MPNSSTTYSSYHKYQPYKSLQLHVNLLGFLKFQLIALALGRNAQYRAYDKKRRTLAPVEISMESPHNQPSTNTLTAKPSPCRCHCYRTVAPMSREHSWCSRHQLCHEARDSECFRPVPLRIRQFKVTEGFNFDFFPDVTTSLEDFTCLELKTKSDWSP